MAVFELVVADRHRVITHRNHEFERERALGQLGERTGEDVTGVEQEDIRLIGTDRFDQRGHLRDTADHVDVVEPVRRNRVVGALNVIRKQQRDNPLVAHRESCRRRGNRLCRFRRLG